MSGRLVSTAALHDMLVVINIQATSGPLLLDRSHLTLYTAADEGSFGQLTSVVLSEDLALRHVQRLLKFGRVERRHRVFDQFNILDWQHEFLDLYLLLLLILTIFFTVVSASFARVPAMTVDLTADLFSSPII